MFASSACPFESIIEPLYLEYGTFQHRPHILALLSKSSSESYNGLKWTTMMTLPLQSCIYRLVFPVLVVPIIIGDDGSKNHE